MNSSQIRAAGAYAQAERLAVSIPVRAIDPSRKRFEVEERPSSEQAPVRARAKSDSSAGQTAASTREGAGIGWRRDGLGLVGAFTAFLTRVFSQSESDDESGAVTATASARAGTQAYSRAVAGTVVNDFDDTSEILTAFFPRLASGRAVDLTV